MDRSRGASDKKSDIGSETGGLDQILFLCVHFIEEPDAENRSGHFREIFSILSKSLYHSFVGKTILFSITLSLLDFLDDSPERIAGVDR